MADYECRTKNGAHVRFSTLKEIYEHHLVAAARTEDEGDAVFVEYYRACALRYWFMFLVGTSLFVDKSGTYVDMTYLRYIIDLSTSWIISYFHCIHGYDHDPLYNDDMPRAARYVLQRRNQKVAPYRVYLDRTAHDDINQMPFKRCMQQFGRVQMIPRSPFKVAPETVTRRELTAIFKDWVHHLVPEEYRCMRATHSWHCVDGYVTWFFKVSHPIMTPDAPGRPPGPAHEELLENQQVEDDHVTDLLSICQRIRLIG
ncbi:uncharacterized protein LOC131646596 [Vicia villosa]|uniref:uncharacterized protein LOC131646596 n=1 Tax=Vicia villosa TaxID=3911 RepID=UPI00273BA7A0|nr:uncharacterized protein LOC131646596 [Vicia villosa]